MRCLSSLLAAVAALALAPAAEAAEAVVDRVPRATPVVEHAGHLAYSRFDGSRYALVVRDPAGGERAVPVPPQAEPFDVDLGSDSRGRPALALSLCGRERGADGRSGGCDLFVHTLGERTLRAVTNANTPLDESTPSLWRGALAFTRSYGEDDPVAYTKRLVAPRSRRSTRQPGVPRRRCGELVEESDCVTRQRRVTQLELRGARLAQSVTYVVEGGGGFRQNEIRLVDVGDRRSRRLHDVTTGLSGQTLLGISFAGGHLGWALTCGGDISACRQIGGAFRLDLAGGDVERDAFARQLSGFAYAGDAVYELRVQEVTCPSGGCPLVRRDEIAWADQARRGSRAARWKVPGIF